MPLPSPASPPHSALPPVLHLTSGVTHTEKSTPGVNVRASNQQAGGSDGAGSGAAGDRAISSSEGMGHRMGTVDGGQPIGSRKWGLVGATWQGAPSGRGPHSMHPLGFLDAGTGSRLASGERRGPPPSAPLIGGSHPLGSLVVQPHHLGRVALQAAGALERGNHGCLDALADLRRRGGRGWEAGRGG